jgi:hypothetical protein
MIGYLSVLLLPFNLVLRTLQWLIEPVLEFGQNEPLLDGIATTECHARSAAQGQGKGDMH